MSITDIIDPEYLEKHGWSPYNDQAVISGLGLWDVNYFSNEQYPEILVQKRGDDKGYELIILKKDFTPINKDTMKTQGDFEHQLAVSLPEYRKKIN